MYSNKQGKSNAIFTAGSQRQEGGAMYICPTPNGLNTDSGIQLNINLDWHSTFIL